MFTCVHPHTRCEGEWERRFRLKVTSRGVGGSEVARSRLNVMK